MHWKRILAVCLILTLLSAVIPATAAGASDLAFVAVNDTIPETLSGGELPFYSRGMLYVPYTVFNATSLGFYPSYNVEGKTLTLFSRSSRLVFDLAGGSVTDEEKVTQQISAISSGGTVFVPASFCANHFGVQVSVLTSLGGYTVVRFKTGSEIYDDSLFIEKAESLISYRVEQYQEGLTPKPPVTEPSDSGNTQSGETTPPETDPEDQEPASICLAITDAVSMEGALELLANEQLHAAFFLTADEIRSYPDLVRRMVAQGHTVGLRVLEDDDPAEALYRGNEALDRVVKYKTLLALVPESLDISGISDSYYILSQPDQRLTATAAAESHGETRLLVCASEQLAVSLEILQEAEAELIPLRETTVFS